ncbi:MAG: hypothetical protein IJ679_10160 [Lachnospiraceae bacterium]|nr:hypothetical protein [Lachnospiraceae bacterium]
MLYNFYTEKMEAEAADPYCAELVREHTAHFGWVPNERLFRCTSHQQFVDALSAALKSRVPLDHILQRSLVFKGSWLVHHEQIPAHLH